MTSQGLFSIGGLASGLDTHEIIDQLMQVERQPIKQIEQQKQRISVTTDAWQQLTTKLSSLRAAVDKVSRTDQLTGLMTATSSHPDAVKVTTSGKVADDALTFDVVALAKAHQVVSDEQFTGLDDLLDGRALTLDIDGQPYDVTAELGPEATVNDLIDTINGMELGVRARGLQVAPGEWELVLTGEQTGTANTFDVSATGWNDDFVVTRQAQDATLSVGGVTVTRGSNTIDDLVDGAVIELVDFPPTSVTVRTSRDVEQAVENIKNFVTALNSMLHTVGELTAYDAESNSAGPLQGQQAASRLAFSLRDALTTPVDNGAGSALSLHDLGISLTAQGGVSLDEAKLTAAVEHQFDDVAHLLGRFGSIEHTDATFLNATSATTPGAHEVVVTQAALSAERVADVVWQAPTTTQWITIERPNGATFLVQFDPSIDTAEAAATAVNEQLAAQAATNLVASATGDGRLQLNDARFGAAFGFTVTEVDEHGDAVGTPELGLNAAVFGQDVAGTIAGVTATGTGATLRANDGPANGLSVRFVGEPDTFTVNYSRGVVGNVAARMALAEGSSGIIAQAKASLDSQRKLHDARIDTIEQRLESREATLRRQFLALETALSRLNDQSSWLDQQLAGLNAQLGR